MNRARLVSRNFDAASFACSAQCVKGGRAVVMQKLGATDWLGVIEAEYREMPGLALTLAQAQRLWSLDAVTCESLLEQLTCAGFLRRTRDGRYCRNVEAT